VSAKTYGLIAEFETPAAILQAAEKVRDAGYHRWDVFTPFPIHGLDKVMGLKNSPVGWFALVFGGGAFVTTIRSSSAASRCSARRCRSCRLTF
jgi:hypothetical protein